LSFILWLAAVAGILGGVHRLNVREEKAAERATGARCAIVIETSDPTDVLPNLQPGEVLRPPLHWFGGHQIVCVPRGKGDRARLVAIRDAADRTYWDKVCPVLGSYEPRCWKR
jgi:hypothetical protein